MKACQVVSQEDLIFDPPQSIAVLFLHEADTNYSSGLIKIYNNEDALFSVHYQSLPKSLLKLNKTEGDLIFLPSWLKIFHHIINDDYIKIVPLKGELPIISHLKLQLLPLFPVPQPFPSDLLISILKASKLTLSTDTIFPIVVSSKMVIFVPKPEKEMPELFSIGNDTEVSFIIPETSKELELDMFAEDIERLMLTLKASRLNLSKETQTHTIFSLSPSAHVQRKAFISGIEKGLGLPKGNCNDIDLDCYAQDEEIENPGDLTEFTKRILSILQTSQNVKLLHLSDCSRFSSHDALKAIGELVIKFTEQFPEATIILSDVGRAPRSLLSSLERHGLKISEFEPSPLNHEQRKAYLERFQEYQEIDLDSFRWLLNGFELDQLGKLAEEFRFTLSMSTGKNAEKAFHQSIESVKNSSTAPNYIRTLSKGMNRWDNIFGYDCVKTKIKDFLYGPVRFADRYSRFGIGLPTGILFYGAPGCGKSFCVQAIANDGIFNVLEIQISELMSKYFGETEERLRDCFRLARQCAPCILYIEGIESLGQRRELGGETADTTGIGERLLSTLLNEMDGIEGIRGVIVLACTNSIDNIDSALKRPGRLDIHVRFDQPNEQDRTALLLGLCSKLKVDEIDDTQLVLINKASEGLSCADIVQVFHEAGRAALKRSKHQPKIGLRDIFVALRKFLEG